MKTKRFENNCWELKYEIKGNIVEYYWLLEDHLDCDEELGFSGISTSKKEKTRIENNKFEVIGPGLKNKYVVDINE